MELNRGECQKDVSASLLVSVFALNEKGKTNSPTISFMDGSNLKGKDRLRNDAWSLQVYKNCT